MAFLSRRQFCLQSAVSVGAFVLPPTTSEPDAALLTAQGVRMLKEGRTFEKAIARFTNAAQKDPTNADIQIALGCACASRAASLAWAGAFAARLAAETAAYPKLLEWIAEGEAAKRQELKDKNADAKERAEFEAELQKVKAKLKPPKGRVFLIKDDKSPFRLTPSELSDRLSFLVKDAWAAWDKGVVLCQTPEEKAHALYVRGWGLWLLRFYCDTESEWRKSMSSFTLGELKDVAPLDVKGVPTDAQITAAFKEASETAPNAALYWQAQADFWAATHERAYPEKEATELYRRAATLDPKNVNLWSHLYDRETTTRYDDTPTDALPAAILDDLHQAQARDKANSLYGYEEASRLFKTVSWSKLAALRYNATEKELQAARDTPRTDAGYAVAKRAVALIERANGLPRFAPPKYQKSIPTLLQSAWNYAPTFWYENILEAYQSRFRELAQACASYAESLAGEKKNQAEAIRVLRIVQAMGLRLMGDPWPTGYDANGKVLLDYGDVMQALTGSAIVGIGYTGLTTIAKKSGDEAFVKQVAEEQAMWKARTKRWYDKRALTNEDEPSVYEVYDRS